jgi:hypothetical protein
MTTVVVDDIVPHTPTKKKQNESVVVDEVVHNKQKKNILYII